MPHKRSTAAGTRVRATGRYVKDQKHGEQLKVESLITVAPSTLEGLGRYLGSGMVPGIGFTDLYLADDNNVFTHYLLVDIIPDVDGGAYCANH